MFNNKQTNPGYGMLSFSRVTGGDPNLFGSSIEHTQKIQLTLRHGEVSRELNQDWYFPQETLFEVEMSYTQFAELISSMNVGSGVPVTIRYIKGEGYLAPIEIENKRKQFREEFETHNDKQIDTIRKTIENLTQIFSEKRQLKVKEKEDILSMLNKLLQDVSVNRDYSVKQFDKAMEKIATEAKGEVEAFVENKLRSVALQAMKEDNKTLEEITENPIVTIE